MTHQFEADLTPPSPLCRDRWPRVRFNSDNGWSASLVIRTRGEDGPEATRAMQASLACAPTGQWETGKTELGESEASADQAIAYLAYVAGRKDGIPAASVHAGLRDGLLATADVDQAYELGRSIVENANERLNAAADRKEASVGTSLLARAIAARALLIVAGDWWASIGKGPAQAYHAALRSFIDEAPPGYVDGSTIEEPAP